MIREAIVRRTGEMAAARLPVLTLDACRSHTSHGRLPVLGGAEADGSCLIEPVVRCSHCGFCQSFGH